MSDETVEVVDDTQGENVDSKSSGLPISLTPEEVTVNYPGFRTPQSEVEIHYELASIDVVIKSLETRKAKLQRDWTHYKLTVHMNHEAAVREATATEEASSEVVAPLQGEAQ